MYISKKKYPISDIQSFVKNRVETASFFGSVEEDLIDKGYQLSDNKISLLLSVTTIF